MHYIFSLVHFKVFIYSFIYLCCYCCCLLWVLRLLSEYFNDIGPANYCEWESSRSQRNPTDLLQGGCSCLTYGPWLSNKNCKSRLRANAPMLSYRGPNIFKLDVFLFHYLMFLFFMYTLNAPFFHAYNVGEYYLHTVKNLSYVLDVLKLHNVLSLIWIEATFFVCT